MNKQENKNLNLLDWKDKPWNLSINKSKERKIENDRRLPRIESEITMENFKVNQNDLKFLWSLEFKDKKEQDLGKEVKL